MFKTYWNLVLRWQLKQLGLILACSVVAAVAEVASLGLIIPVISLFSSASAMSNPVVKQVAGWMARHGLNTSQEWLLFTLLCAIAALILIRNVLVLITGYIVDLTSSKIMRELTYKLFGSYVTADYSLTQSLHRGEMLDNSITPAKDVATFI